MQITGGPTHIFLKKFCRIKIRYFFAQFLSVEKAAKMSPKKVFLKKWRKKEFNHFTIVRNF